MKIIKDRLNTIIKQLYDIEITAELARPRADFGDLASNVSLVLAKQLSKNPLQIAQTIAEELRLSAEIAEVTVDGPGFINLKLSDELIKQAWSTPIKSIFQQQTVVVEYSDPNPFKVLHAGHFYTSVIGDAIANLVEVGGGKVYRVNFGGDVGLHVAKTIWAISRQLGGENPDALAAVEPKNRADWLAKHYVEGTKAYDDNQLAHQEIVAINKRIYQIQADQDKTSPLAKIYWTCRTWSYDYFDDFYSRIGSRFDKYYPESATLQRGLSEVKSRLGTVFKLSEGAVIFEGEKYGLHNRVFINGDGLPTYETKDIGLVFCKFDDYQFDRSIIITANEQKQYMEVVLKALEQFAPKLAIATTHITHGMVKLAGGVKMSSRKGNFLRAIDVLDAAKQANLEQNQVEDERVALGAVKYAFLKPRISGDIVYDPKESVSLVGNSGPYLQYAHARACSILRKASVKPKQINDFEPEERALAVKLGQFSEVLNEATANLFPHLICTYLYELAQEFNRFYEQALIIGHQRQAERLDLVKQYQVVLARGLKLLNIIPLETM